MLVPCYNEQVAIPSVVQGFPRGAAGGHHLRLRQQLAATARSTAARAAGAVVRSETLQGKGHVVRRMFADIEADAYVLVDGDDTYDARLCAGMVRLLLDDRSTWSMAPG